MKSAHSGILDKVNPRHRKPNNGGSGHSGLAPFHNDKYFHLIADNARDLIFHAQYFPTFRFDYVSPSSTRITGYTPEEFYADPLLAKKCIHPDDLHLLIDPNQPGAPPIYEPLDMRWRCKDGRMIWTEHMVTLTRDESGEPVSCQIIARDITKRKKAEEDLLEIQKFNASLLENAPHATVVINPDTSVKYVNPAWEILNGWTLAEVVGTKAPYPWWPEEFIVAFAEGFKQAMKQGTGKAEILTQKKNGELYWIDINWASVMNNGELLYLLINSVDITEHKRMEEALQESEEKFSVAFRSSPDMMAIINLQNGKFVEVNASYAHILGYSHEELVGHQVDEFNLWANTQDAEKMNRLITEKGKIRHEEFQFRSKSGEIRIWLCSVDTINVGGEPCMLCVATDITERKQAQKALRESEEKFSAAFQSSPDMIIITDTTEGKYIEVNDSFIQNTGYKREELVGHSVSEIDLWVEPAEAERFTRTIQEQGKVRNEEFKFRRKTGEIRTWLCSADVVSIGGERRMLAVAADITERKNTEEALKESEEKFSKAFHASPFSISISRLGDGKFIEVNDSFLRDKGYTREEIIGHSSKGFEIWANQNESLRIMKALKAGEQVHNQQAQFRTKSGHIRTGLISADIINISNEPCMLVMNNDITQQKLAEAQLRLLSSVTQQVTDSIIITDLQFNITYMNQAAQDLFGYTFEEVRGKNLGFFTKTPPSADYKQSVRATVSSGKVFSSIVLKQRKDGTTIICDCRVSPMYDEKGEIRSYIDVQRDVTKQEEMEAKLQEHKKLIDSILATMPEGVLVIDSNNRIILANKAFHDIFHPHKTAIQNRPLNEILPVNQFFDLHKAVKSGDKDNNTLEFRYQVQGLEKIIYCIIVKMDGQRTLLTFSDISREREEEEKLYLTDRLASIGEMAAGLAHELNNPLTGILALSQMLVSSDIPEEHKEDLECINNEAKRAAGIVKNVLLFARNKTDISGWASINDVVKDVLRLREYEERASNIKVVTDLEENLPDILIDKGQLQQVFLNILSNAEAAIKEVDRPGVITVATQRVNNHVNILLSDNGCGIKKQIIPRLFDPFFTTKEIGKGTGLGLSICYSIVVKHGGKISVKSQVNEGTTFTIRMPVVLPEK